MANHVKPSRADLQAGIKAAQDQLDKLPLETTPPAEPPATPPATPPEPPVTPPATPPEPPTPPVEPPVTPPATPPATPPEPPVTPPGGIDWKKKFSESSREAQVQGFKNKEIQRAVDAAAQIPEPSEDDLKKEYPKWEEMTETEQVLAKDNLLNKRRFELVHEATAKFKQVDEWNEKVDGFLADPQTLIAHPELEGKTEEFKQFSSKPTRRGLDLDDLILAFSGEQAKTKPAPHKGGMFEQGSGGPHEPPKPVSDGKLSVEEGRALMKTDYKKWKEMLISGKIRNE